MLFGFDAVVSPVCTLYQPIYFEYQQKKCKYGKIGIANKDKNPKERKKSLMLNNTFHLLHFRVIFIHFGTLFSLLASECIFGLCVLIFLYHWVTSKVMFAKVFYQNKMY